MSSNNYLAVIYDYYDNKFDLFSAIHFEMVTQVNKMYESFIVYWLNLYTQTNIYI